jgi:hypothetical protein
MGPHRTAIESSRLTLAQSISAITLVATKPALQMTLNMMRRDADARQPRDPLFCITIPVSSHIAQPVRPKTGRRVAPAAVRPD